MAIFVNNYMSITTATLESKIGPGFVLLLMFVHGNSNEMKIKEVIDRSPTLFFIFQISKIDAKSNIRYS